MGDNVIETNTTPGQSDGQPFLDRAQEMRRLIYTTITKARGGHMPSSLSVVEILTVLYGEVLRIDPMRPDDPNRDRFILSKGHGCVALYAALSQYGFIDASHLDTFGRAGSILGGHPDMHKVSGVEASTGSLGHGLSFAAGIALAAKMDGKTHRTFVLMGDGECQEGSVWEAALFAVQAELDNLVCIVDHNKLQAMDRLDKIVELSPMAEKWRAFGWEVMEVEGNDIGMLRSTFSELPFKRRMPSLVVAHTTKGKGISFMEQVPIWHYRMPDETEDGQARKELGLS